MADKQASTTPKDFVLWVGTMLTLYISVGSLITLLFSYINILFPDPLQMQYYYSYDPYSGSIRFAMASLIIIVPIFIALTRYVNQDLRKNPEKKTLGIRKWLLYLTLLAAGAFIAGDLIALVNGFLGGDLTTSFLLKVLVILLVAGSVFGYYFGDLRGRWEKEEKQSKLIGVVLFLVVLGSIVSGFVLLGSPTTQRELRFDQERLSHLQNVQWEVLNYWQSTQQLPQTLTEIGDGLSGFVVPTDPQTNQPYRYEVLSQLSFRLCATFTHESSQQQSLAPEKTFAIVDSNWEHGVGESCFTREIDPQRYGTTDAPYTMPIEPRPINI